MVLPNHTREHGQLPNQLPRPPRSRQGNGQTAKGVGGYITPTSASAYRSEIDKERDAHVARRVGDALSWCGAAVTT
jgi:hypothetical protein